MKLVAVEAFVGAFFPGAKSPFVVTWILPTNTANMSSSNGSHEFLVVFVLFSFGFSLFLCLPAPGIDDTGVEIAIEATISHIVKGVVYIRQII